MDTKENLPAAFNDAIFFQLLHQDASEKILHKEDSYEHMLFEKGYQRTHIARQAFSVILEVRIEHQNWNLDFQKPESERQFQEGKTSIQTNGQTETQQPFKVSYYAFARFLDEFKEIQEQIVLQVPG